MYYIYIYLISLKLGIEIGLMFISTNIFMLFCRTYLFEGAPEDPNYNPLPEDRPGGFNWGEPQNRQEDGQN